VFPLLFVAERVWRYKLSIFINRIYSKRFMRSRCLFMHMRHASTLYV